MPSNSSSPANPSPGGCSFSADLRHHDLVELLQLLESSRRSGTASIESSAGLGTIELRRGKVVAASAPAELPFGRLVVEAADASDSAQERAIGERAAAAQICHAVRQLVGWHSGVFCFTPHGQLDTEPVQDEPALPGPGVGAPRRRRRESVEIALQSLLMEALEPPSGDERH